MTDNTATTDNNQYGLVYVWLHVISFHLILVSVFVHITLIDCLKCHPVYSVHVMNDMNNNLELHLGYNLCLESEASVPKTAIP